MAIAILPEDIRSSYDVYEYRHAIAILKTDFPSEYEDIIAMLRNFKLKRQDIITAGGSKSAIAASLDEFLTGNRKKRLKEEDGLKKSLKQKSSLTKMSMIPLLIK